MPSYEINNLPSPIDWECNDDIQKRTLQNAKNLLMLRMGELPYDRYRGFDMNLIELPDDEFNAQLLPEITRDMLWDPDVNVTDVGWERIEQGQVVIYAQVELGFETGGE